MHASSQRPQTGILLIISHLRIIYRLIVGARSGTLSRFVMATRFTCLAAEQMEQQKSPKAQDGRHSTGTQRKLTGTYGPGQAHLQTFIDQSSNALSAITGQAIRIQKHGEERMPTEPGPAQNLRALVSSRLKAGDLRPGLG